MWLFMSRFRGPALDWEFEREKREFGLGLEWRLVSFGISWVCLEQG
jgi:hypothetical protein